MKRLALLGFGLLGAAATIAAAPDDRFQAANAAYQAGRFEEARAGYESLTKDGLGGFALYYNLGNVNARAGRLGWARLWYERALHERPGDDDARANQRWVRARVNDGEEESIGGTVGRWAAILSWLALAANGLFFGVLILGLFVRHEAVWWGRWAAGMVFAAFLVAAAAARRDEATPRGVVVSARVEARTGPSANERVGFVVPEGHRVTLFDAQAGWRQIGLPAQGLKGWVPEDTVQPVDFN